MNARAFGTVLVMLAVAACAEPEAPDTDGTWVGTITTEGNVTTVVNESGSVWGGTARLVEEASIGVETGREEYMFARITALAADDRHIYVVETRPPVVRVYDLDGTHIRNIGTRGQGPGEFAFPESIVVMPDGRLMVRDDEHLLQIGRPELVGPDGNVYTVVSDPFPQVRRYRVEIDES